MAGDERLTRLEASPSTPDTRARAVTLGLIAAPDIPEKIAKELAPELPDLLAKRIDGAVSWEVPVVVDPLTGTDRQAPEILDACRQRRLEEGLDFAICLTDLPIYRSDTLVAADVSAGRAVAGISIPALGTIRLRTRTRQFILELARELYDRSGEHGADDRPAQDPKATGSVGSFRKVDTPDEDMKAMGVEARFVSPGPLGHLRLWSGMVLANRPWRMLPAFKGAIAAAFATGAYVLAISSMWLLADAMGFWRLLALMVVAIIAMVAWIIVAHHLWERPQEPQQRRWASLYNGVSVLTLSVAVLLAYAILLVLLFAAAWVFVPGDYFQSILKHQVGVRDYLTLCWLGASLATVAGALGASLEDEEKVRGASYGYRQRRRQEDDEGDSEEESRDVHASR